jgi:uncharacterized LabA/DUF88 family protein
MNPAKRTVIYVDGFNLYYGCLKNTPYKWLDLKVLFSKLLDKSHDIKKIKYFTAHISNRPGNNEARLKQRYYLLALAQHIPELEIHLGHYLTHEINAKVVNPPPEFIRVYKTEEKGSDVNLALEILNDGWLNAYDCAVVVSNDSDLAAALRLIKKQHNKKVGLVFPNSDHKRKPSKELSQHADFIKMIRHHILQDSQLPEKIINSYNGEAIYKPQGW